MILMQLSLLMQQMLLILLTVKLPAQYLCTVYILLYHPKNTYGAPIRLFITGEGELASTKELLRVIHLPWLCISLLLLH